MTMVLKSQICRQANSILAQAGSISTTDSEMGRYCHTELVFENLEKTIWTVLVSDAHGHCTVVGNPSRLSISLDGESEKKTMIKALEFMLKTLKED